MKAILNVSAPNTYLILERAYEAYSRAFESRSSTVRPEHVIETEEEIIIPTVLESLILGELVKVG